MPRLSAWFVRAALIYLLLGFTFGGLLLAHKGLGFMPIAWNLLPSHVEMLFLGWTFQLAAGVSYWILPRFGRGAPRGDPRPAWAAFYLLNAGIILVVVQPWLAQAGLAQAGLTQAGLAVDWLLPAGRVGEASGAMLYLLAMWKRVKPFAQ